MGIYAIMLPSGGFSVAHCLTMRMIQCVRSYNACDHYTIIYHDQPLQDLKGVDKCGYAAI